jgi:4-amino-4-deoxy-L-arabinose transferase-like glycosyltransferase
MWPSLMRPLTLLRVIVSLALFGRLGGAGRTWLPPVVWLGGILVVLLAIDEVRFVRDRLPKRPGMDWWAFARRYGFSVALATLMMLALMIRVPAIGRDLWHVPLDIDEHRLAASVKHFFVTGAIDHQTVEHYPGLVFWIVTASSFVAYMRALTGGVIRDISQMPLELFVLAGRTANVFVAVATVGVTGLLGRRVSTSAAGLLAAGVVAIVPLAVQTTMALRNDPGQTLVLTAAVYAAMVAYGSDRRMWTVIAGALAGVATAIKYSSAFALAAAVLAAALAGPIGARLRRVGLTVLAFGVAVATTNHFVWADFANFIRQLSDQVAITGSGHWAATTNPAAFYPRTLADAGPGWALLLLGVAFGAYALATRRHELWIFLTVPLMYVWFMSQRPSQLPRWAYPVVPFVAVAGAAGLVGLMRALRAWPIWARSRGGPVSWRLTSVLLVLGALAQPVWISMSELSRRLTPSTHEVLEAWLQEHVARGEVVLLGAGWLDVSRSSLRVRRVPDLAATLSGSVYQLAASNWIVVPEPYFRNPGLTRLQLVHRVHAHQTAFAGHSGYDYEVYIPRSLPAAPERAEVALDDPQATPYLGSEWVRDKSGRRGLLLPASGASIFLPPLAQSDVRLEFEIVGRGAPLASPPLSLTVAGHEISLTAIPSMQRSAQLLVAAFRPDPSANATELRLRPTRRSRQIRIMRFRFG